jgi:selenocysteine lyase/cysteine desulfurase
VRHVRRLGIENIHAYESSLYRRARELLGNIKGIRIYAPDHVGSVLLFNKDGFSPELLSQKLDENGFCTRGGYHCSPLGHKTLGTLENGAVRLSFGIFNKKGELDLLARVLSSL